MTLSRKFGPGKKVDPQSNICLPKMDWVDQKWTWLEHACAYGGLEAEATAILVDNPRLSLFWVTIWQVTGDERSHQHLVQRLSIALLRGNAASVLGTLSKDADFGD